MLIADGSSIAAGVASMIVGEREAYEEVQLLTL